jgi:signal recognition particle subunit SRP54
MTPAERQDPKILNGSRRARIANGSGATVSDVNALIERFSEAQKMMKQMGKRRHARGMPGMPGMPGMGGSKKSKGRMAKSGKPPKGKSRSGNPAKRAAAPEAIEAESATAPAFDVSQLPPELKNLLN